MGAECIENNVIANQPAGWCGNPFSKMFRNDILNLIPYSHGLQTDESEIEKAPTKWESSVFYMADNVLNSAIQRVAKGVQSLGADGFSLLNSVKGIGGKSLLIYQIIFFY